MQTCRVARTALKNMVFFMINGAFNSFQSPPRKWEKTAYVFPVFLEFRLNKHGYPTTL